MNKIKEVISEVEEMRETMQILIEEKGNLLDDEIIKASKDLDQVLNKYNKLLKKKNKE